MNKLIPIAIILGLLLGVSAILAVPVMASPPISRPTDLTDYTIYGGAPQTVDYSAAYDTASGEMIQNFMDTLLIFPSEGTSAPFLYGLATAEVDGPVVGGVSSIGLPNPPATDSIAGLNFENTGQPGPYATYYWQYDFKLRQGVLFAPPYNYSLTGADVAFSFQRTMFQDRASGPQWMIQEPLLDQAGGLNEHTTGGLIPNINSTYATQEAEVGQLVKDSVQYNATDVWFNLMFPGAYAPFLQILCQTWSSIESQQWIDNQVITGAGRKDWGGFSFYSGNLTSWIPMWNPAPGTWPLDTPTPMAYGSGAFILTPGTPDYTHDYWAITRNFDWWGGAPTFYPVEAGVGPAGYVDSVEEYWGFTWASTQAAFKGGSCDYAALPALSNMPDIYQKSGPNFYPYPSTSTNLPDNGIRCYADLPTLEADGLFFTMNVTPGVNSGTIFAPVTGLNPYPSADGSGIPSNFFGNEPFGNPYGIDMRKAFAYSIDYATELAVAAEGEGIIPATAIIEGLYGYNASITGYNYNLTMAQQYFQMWPGLWSTGFTITLCYNSGNGERQQLCTLIQTALQGMNSNFHVTVTSLSWNDYLTAAFSGELPTYVIGWLADFPDPHDFALPFYHTGGAFAVWQSYSNLTMDSLINQAITLPNGAARAVLYSQIAELAIADCPSVTVLQGLGRHFEYDWVQGYYYNPITMAGGLFTFANMYKFYYVPEATQPSPTQPFSEYLPADVNRDGVVNMKDIAVIARAFGSSYTQPLTANWVAFADLVNIRTINMKSIAFVARQFGTTSPLGTFGPIVTIKPMTNVVAAGSSITFTATLLTGYGNPTGRVIQWYYGTLDAGENGPATAGPTGATFTWSSVPAGSSYVYCVVTDTFTGSVLTARLGAGLSSTATSYSMWAGIYAS